MTISNIFQEAKTLEMLQMEVKPRIFFPANNFNNYFSHSLSILSVKILKKYNNILNPYSHCSRKLTEKWIFIPPMRKFVEK